MVTERRQCYLVRRARVTKDTATPATMVLRSIHMLDQHLAQRHSITIGDDGGCTFLKKTPNTARHVGHSSMLSSASHLGRWISAVDGVCGDSGRLGPAPTSITLDAPVCTLPSSAVDVR